MNTFDTFEEAVETLGMEKCLELINYALRSKETANRASKRYRLRNQMVMKRMKEIAAAQGVDVEELMASDTLAELE